MAVVLGVMGTAIGALVAIYVRVAVVPLAKQFGCAANAHEAQLTVVYDKFSYEPEPQRHLTVGFTSAGGWVDRDGHRNDVSTEKARGMIDHLLAGLDEKRRVPRRKPFMYTVSPVFLSYRLACDGGEPIQRSWKESETDAQDCVLDPPQTFRDVDPSDDTVSHRVHLPSGGASRRGPTGTRWWRTTRRPKRASI